MPSTAAITDAERLGIEIVEEPCANWPLVLSRYSFRASVTVGGERFEGFGCAADADEARLKAFMECLERTCQFGPRTLRPDLLATPASLNDEAISLEKLGLYSEAQYQFKEFPCAKPADHEVVEWVKARDLCNGNFKFIPIEFVYPRVQLKRKRLVAETSNGTAAHSSIVSARLAAYCELIERDSILMFWARQPATGVLPIDDAVSHEAAFDIRQMIRMGNVVVVCTPTYDLEVPCVLAVALSGSRMAYGAGCHPDLKKAADHAIQELGRLLRWRHIYNEQPRRIALNPRVETAADHFALYDEGAFHDLFRRVLDNVVRPGAAPARSLISRPSDREALDITVESLKRRGYKLFECDITSDAACSAGAVVARFFAPGLIPLSFGADMIRYGAERLWSSKAPGRFCNTLPHFLN